MFLLVQSRLGSYTTLLFFSGTGQAISAAEANLHELGFATVRIHPSVVDQAPLNPDPYVDLFNQPVAVIEFDDPEVRDIVLSLPEDGS